MKSIALILGGAFAMTASVALAQDASTDTLATQLADNPIFEAAKAREDAAEAEIDLARSAKRPQLRGDAEIGYLRETLTLPVPLEPGGPNSLTGEREPIRIGVGVEQLLFDNGVSTAGINVARTNQQAASFETEALRQDLYLASATTILQVRFNMDLMKERELALELASARLDDVTARQEAGLATITDVDQAKARRALAMAEQAEARRALLSAQNDLQRLTGDSTLSAPPPLREAVLTNSNPQSLLAQAVANNPTYLAALERAESSQFALDQARGQDGPQIAFVAEAAYARDERFGLQLGEAEQLGAFVRGTWRFGTGGARSARITRSRSLQRAATFDVDTLRRQLDDDIRSTLSDIDATNAAIDARRQQVEAATTAQIGVGFEVETGRRTELDRLDADRAVAGAQIELRRAETDRQTALLRLRRLVGEL